MDNPETGPSEALSVSQGSEAFEALLDSDYADPAEPAEAPTTEAAHEPADPAPVDPATDPEPTPEPESEAELFTVKIDGKERKVSKEELLAGYQRQADYTKKTMDIAEARKTAEAETSAARAEREQYAQNLQRNQAILEASLQEQKNIDWNALLETDPVEYLKQQHLAQSRQAALQQTYQQQAELQKQFHAEHEQSRAVRLTDQREQLLAKIPEWADEAKRTAGAAEVREYLRKDGLTDAQIDGALDHRMIVHAYKAMKHDKLIADAKAAAKRVAATPQRTERPGGAEPASIDKRGAAFQRLNKSGSVKDAASVFESLL